MVRPRPLRTFAALASALALAGVAAGCGASPSPQTVQVGGDAPDALDWNVEPGLSSPAGCAEADAQLRSMATTWVSLELERNRRALLAEAGLTTSDSPIYEAPKLPEAGGGAGDAPEAPGTPDRVKVSGDRVLALVAGRLVAVETGEGRLEELGSVAIHGEPWALAAFGTRAVVVSRLAEPSVAGGAPERPIDPLGVTVVTVVDVAEATAPTIVAEQAIEGQVRLARAEGGALRLLVTTALGLPEIALRPDGLRKDADHAAIDAAFAKLAAQATATLAEINLVERLPRRWELRWDGQLDPDSQTTVAGCEALLAPGVYSGGGFGTVVSVSPGGLSAGLQVADAVVLGRWSAAAARPGALILATSNWSWFWLWSGEDKPEVRTHLHRLEPGVGWTGSASLAGYPTGRRPIDLRDGRIRVATAEGDTFWGWGYAPEATLRVSVLKDAPEGLAVTGELGGLGQGEPIRDVLWSGARAYALPQRDAAPLRVVALDGPAPVEGGAIASPGVWGRVVPLGDTRVGVLGMESIDAVAAVMQLWDTTDAAAPVMRQETALGLAGSVERKVLWDAPAWRWFPSAGLLTVPVEVRALTAEGWWYNEPRIEVLSVTDDAGVVVQGQVSHMALYEPDTCDGAGAMAARVDGVGLDSEHLYAVSAVGVTAHSLETFGNVATSSLALPPDASGCAAP